MAKSDTESGCGHAGCTCKSGERGFCSPYCEGHARGHASGGTHRCECGHPGCGGA